MHFHCLEEYAQWHSLARSVYRHHGEVTWNDYNHIVASCVPHHNYKVTNNKAASSLRA